MDRAKAAAGCWAQDRQTVEQYDQGHHERQTVIFTTRSSKFANAPGHLPFLPLRGSETLRPARATARLAPAPARLTAHSGHYHDARYTVITDVSAKHQPGHQDSGAPDIIPDIEYDIGII